MNESTPRSTHRAPAHTKETRRPSRRHHTTPCDTTPWSQQEGTRPYAKPHDSDPTSLLHPQTHPPHHVPPFLFSFLLRYLLYTTACYLLMAMVMTPDSKPTPTPTPTIPDYGHHIEGSTHACTSLASLP